MNIIWGAVLIVFTLLLCWLGQVIAVTAPDLAVRLGLAGSRDEEDSTYYVDGQAEARWDVLSLWTLPLAGVLLILDNTWWAYLGLVGGGMYVYFAGRGIVVRLAMQRHGIRIGTPNTVKLFIAVLSLWGIIGLVTIFIAVAALPLPPV